MNLARWEVFRQTCAIIFSFASILRGQVVWMFRFALVVVAVQITCRVRYYLIFRWRRLVKRLPSVWWLLERTERVTARHFSLTSPTLTWCSNAVKMADHLFTDEPSHADCVTEPSSGRFGFDNGKWRFEYAVVNADYHIPNFACDDLYNRAWWPFRYDLTQLGSNDQQLFN